MKQELRKDYEEYITSKEWFDKRKQVFKLLGEKCQKCLVTNKLHVHHKTYIRFKNENIETDLTVLCNSCHNYYHKIYNKTSIETTDFFINDITGYKYKFVPKRRLSTQQRIERNNDKLRMKKERRKIRKEKLKLKLIHNPSLTVLPKEYLVI